MTIEQEKELLERKIYGKTGKWATVRYGDVNKTGNWFYIQHIYEKEILGLTYEDSKINIKSW